MVDKKILILFILITLVFSILVYKPFDVVIAGPQMTDIEYFKDELQIIENSTGLKIKYEIYSDIETHLADNHNTDIDFNLEEFNIYLGTSRKFLIKFVLDDFKSSQIRDIITKKQIKAHSQQELVG